jgi:hypothetical protein
MLDEAELRRRRDIEVMLKRLGVDDHPDAALLYKAYELICAECGADMSTPQGPCRYCGWEPSTRKEHPVATTKDAFDALIQKRADEEIDAAKYPTPEQRFVAYLETEAGRELKSRRDAAPYGEPTPRAAPAREWDVIEKKTAELAARIEQEGWDSPEGLRARAEHLELFGHREQAEMLKSVAGTT